MRYVLLLVLAVVCVGVVGCYSTPIMPPTGWVYSEFKAPLDPNLEKTTLGKPGVALTTSILGMVALGDCSIEAAAKNGNLKTINYADYEYYNILGIYQKFTVKVYGE